MGRGDPRGQHNGGVEAICPTLSPNPVRSAPQARPSRCNLAAMVANANDLVEGQNHSGRGSASTAGRAIRTYREQPPTGRQGLQATTTREGSN